MIKNLKKVISSIAAVAILATSASAFAVTFPDVDESASYANSVEILTAFGIVNGDDNGKFNPDNTVTRAEFAKMVVEALGEGEAAASSTYTKFDDTKTHWAAGYVEMGVAKKFINGYDEKTFGPDDTVTYAQAVKMLVAACGYELYAEKQGGWPTGYLAYGSSLDIINGVKGVTNDTALTRAQCAVLIANALKAPICDIVGYNPGGLTGDVYSPVYEPLDGDKHDFESLLTRHHDAYVVKGRVEATSKAGVSGLEKGEVKFKIESSLNFDDEKVKVSKEKDDEGETVYAGYKEIVAAAGATDAEDMLFEYAEAIIYNDPDTDDNTIINIVQYGNSKSVEFAAADVADDSDAAVIKVYKSESSTKTNKYELDADAEFYVNGVSLDAVDADKIADYILANANGVVTLVDKTDIASTSTDGDYDIVNVSFYATTVVADASTKGDTARINATIGERLTWDTTDEDMSVKFTLDGEEIDYTTLQPYDVLLVAYDVETGLKESSFYDVLVARNAVTGTVTSYYDGDTEQTITVDGTVYNVEDATAYTKGTEYTLYLDAFNNVAYSEVGTSSKKLAVFVGMYEAAGADRPTIKLVTADGEEVSYEAKSTDDADAFDALVDHDDEYSVKLSDVKAEGIENCVVEYKLSGGKIVFVDSVTPNMGAAADGYQLEYNANTTMLGKYMIDAASTKVLDLEAYLSTNGGAPAVMSVDAFEDDLFYQAYAYDRNINTSVYGFVIVEAGTTSIKPENAFSIVTEIGGSATASDDTDVTEVTVACNGEEGIEILVADTVAGALTEGAIIAYKVNSVGYVEDVHVIFTPVAASYKALYEGVMAKAVFAEFLSSDSINEDYEIEIDGRTSSKEVKVTFGPVLKNVNNVITVLSGQDDGLTSITDAEVYNIANANAYTYNYDLKADRGVRVTAGGVSQAQSTFNSVYVAGDKTTIDWSKNYETVENEDGDEEVVYAGEAEPAFVFIKTVDNVASDVVFFVAE